MFCALPLSGTKIRKPHARINSSHPSLLEKVIQAVKDNKEALIKQLLAVRKNLIKKSIKPHPVPRQNKLAQMPLHCVLSAKIARLLIEAQNDINEQDFNGSSPLHYARTKEIAQVLIQAGAATNIVNNQGATPFETHTSADTENKAILLLLLQNNARITFNRALYSSYESAVKAAVGDDFLTVCFVGNNNYLISALLKNPALANRTANGITPLQAATSQGHEETVALLVAHKAQVTPEYIHLATKYKYHKIVNMLTAAYQKQQPITVIPAPSNPSQQQITVKPIVQQSNNVQPTPESPLQKSHPLPEITIQKAGSLPTHSLNLPATIYVRTPSKPLPDIIIQPAGSLPRHQLRLPTTSIRPNLLSAIYIMQKITRFV